MRKLPQQLWRSSLAPYPPTEALLEANLMTSAHFSNHTLPPSPKISVSLDHFPAEKAKAGLRALEGAPS